MKQTLEFSEITSIEAESFGEPGKRTFRIVVSASNGSAIMWLEKEQLLQLALAIQELLQTLPNNTDNSDIYKPSNDKEFVNHIEFHIGKLVLAHEGDNRRFIIDAYDLDKDTELPVVRIWGEKGELTNFADNAIKICSAGRPVCPLCNVPMESSGHVCPKVNGHNLHSLTKNE